MKITESQLRSIIKESIKNVLNEMYDTDFEDSNEYNLGKKYHKYSVEGHTYKLPEPMQDKHGNWMSRTPIIDYPYEEFDNIDDARTCADKFKKMDGAIPDNVRIKGHYKTLADDGWEYVQ